MAASPDRAELAKICGSRNWSKAIRVLDALLAQSCSIQDICNRAFCYSKLELHKHVIKDCDKALQLDPTLLQAYILKGNALLALGRKEDASLVWEQGYEHALRDSKDLKLLLELEDLLASVKQSKPVVCQDHALDTSPCDTKVVVSEVSVVHSDTIPTADMKTVVCEEQVVDSSSKVMMNSDSGSEIDNTSGSEDMYEITSQPSNSQEIIRRCNETIKPDHKLFVTNISKSKSISLDFRLSRGIGQVNEGNYDQAISIFDQILRETPKYPEALIGRGTAYAFQRELDAAIADFTKAIQYNPSAGEAWKRRGQARAAIGEFMEAIEDLSKALEFEPSCCDILHERGIVNFKFKDYNAAVEDLSACVNHDRKNSSAYTYLGLALSAIGEYQRAEEAHLKAIQLDENFLEGWAHLAQYYQDLANQEKALHCLEKVLLVDKSYAKAYHLRGLLYHGMGLHRMAIKDLSLGLSFESSNIECLYLRASCYHAIGDFKAAKEIALYTASRANFEFSQFNIDGDVDPLFKEYWCKRLHPKNVAERVFRQPPLRTSLKGGRISKKEFNLTKHQDNLLQAADSIGKKIQYNCPGFLPNKRQYRMAGLAAIEIAQKVAKAWRGLRNVKKSGKQTRKKEKLGIVSQNRGGGCCSSSSSSDTSTSYSLNEDRHASGRTTSWQDIYHIAVKWRQISEPCDPVVWVNKLSEEFNSGFGSHTPMLLGQAKVVRYYSNYERILDTAKSVIKERKYVNIVEDKSVDPSALVESERISNAVSCSDLYNVVGENFWVATTCNSTAFEGKPLEGTRITVQKMDKIGFDFAIRTPCTPSRWEEYDAEMAAAWEALCTVYCGELFGSNDVNMLGDVKDAILRMTYYWYNFMPLSRGSAAVGYTVLLGLFLAANMEVTASIPPGMQVDWEAILTSNPEAFSEIIKKWLYPSIKFNRSWKDYPDVTSTFSTTGSIIAALSSYKNETQ
ncbi:suppressor of RPS4-RLD 1 isoform X2 [Ananas comosus]|uniref:Suppressor of RPS4-RLD 1 isoform X2 n=1 Tax=Ananas comosus TaxID=4615 RepID=A0A6P5F6Y9_ANACO|nr:suppressor of RPS4-RLD 1 isoform X2 [Ananas comosus]